MAYSITKENMIDYEPIALKDFHLYAYEWIDNLNFTINPSDVLTGAAEYIDIAKKRFLEEGWHGDGEVELMWIPPFMFKDNGYHGIIIWHVKQESDGISWILSPVELPYL